MKLGNLKFFVGVLILLAYLGIGIFGLVKFSHMPKTSMSNCPYAENGFSVCDNGIDHINDWRQFSSVTPSSLFIFPFLIFGIVLYFFGKQNLLNQKRYFYRWKHYLDNKKLYSSQNKIIKWLSLFENSPTLSYVRHS